MNAIPENLATQADGAHSRYGNRREEHRFALAQALAHDDFLGQPIAECDHMISQALQRLPTLTDQISIPVKPMRSPHRTRAQTTQLHQALNQVFGVNLTCVPTLGIDTVLVLASEIGPDLSCFPSARYFGFWLGLASPTRISGGQTSPAPSPRSESRTQSISLLLGAFKVP